MSMLGHPIVRIGVAAIAAAMLTPATMRGVQYLLQHPMDSADDVRRAAESAAVTGGLTAGIYVLLTMAAQGYG